ncbi:MAG: hypothetical protein IMZ52_10005 [Actinobacteria bacterium]|nr:hypothetical protein [Actinomycetota bacterium]MBE3122104.1 hypothetical protein [Thermoplasmata archaeon]
MKTLYNILLFFAIFQMTAITVGVLGIFPAGSTLYSDIDYNELAGYTSPADILAYFFIPTGVILNLGTTFSIVALVSAIGIGGGLVSIVTKDVTPVLIAIVGLCLIPMLVKSQSFFSKLFSIGNSQALIYLGLTLGVGFIIIAAITLIELPAHGDS